MSSFFLFPLLILAGFAGGWWASRWQARAQGGQPPQAAPAVAPEPLPHPVAEGADAAPAQASMELHLVLNVMNRVIMGMQHDEHLQDGVTYIADYLRAVHELQRQPSQNALVQQLSAYWRLSRWLHGQASDALHVDAQAPGLSAAQLARCNAVLIRAIRDLEACPRADAAMRMASAGGAGVSLQVNVAGLSAAAQAQLLGGGREWRQSGTALLQQTQLQP